MIYAFAISLAFTHCMYQRYQFSDLRNIRNLTWKRWRIIECVVIFAGILLQPDLYQLFVAGALYWAAFEIGTNIISLNRPALFVGNSGGFDSLGKWKWLVILFTLILSLWVMNYK